MKISNAFPSKYLRAADLQDRPVQLIMSRVELEDVGGEDWEELVVPDLREGFQDELAEIGALIESAIFNAASGPGPIWITPGDAFPWYSSLNQARLALEEIHHFGPEEEADPRKMSPVQRAAFIRSGFYSDIQSLLLRHVMR